jgi:hypothetical protein
MSKKAIKNSNKGALSATACLLTLAVTAFRKFG